MTITLSPADIQELKDHLKSEISQLKVKIPNNGPSPVAMSRSEAIEFLGGAEVLVVNGEKTGHLKPLTLAGRGGKIYDTEELKVYWKWIISKNAKNDLPPNITSYK